MQTRRSIPAVSLAVLITLFAACNAESPTMARPVVEGKVAGEPKVSVCHKPGEDPTVIDIGAAALNAHLGHGDYVAGMLVDPDGDSGDGVHFRRIGDALAAASASRIAHDEREAGACRITITVAAGQIVGTESASADAVLEQFPLVIDVPDITLRGAFDMALDDAARASGNGTTEAATVIGPREALTTISQYSQPIIFVNAHPEGFAGDGVVIEGFVFRSGQATIDAVGGAAVVSLRVRDLVIRGNRIEAGFSEGADLRASSGTVVDNFRVGAGGTCDICLAGPGRYRAEGNTLVGGGIPGILITPATLLPVPSSVEQYTLPRSSEVIALALNNQVRDHLRKPVGVGLRIATVGVGAPNVAGTATVELRGNLLVNNNFGIILEAGFPVANTTLRGDANLVLRDNSIIAACQNSMLVSLSRHTTALGLSALPYLRNSGYVIDLGNTLSRDELWYGNPAGFNNSLVVDGEAMPYGVHAAYDAARTCPPLP